MSTSVAFRRDAVANTNLSAMRLTPSMSSRPNMARCVIESSARMTVSCMVLPLFVPPPCDSTGAGSLTRNDQGRVKAPPADGRRQALPLNSQRGLPQVPPSKRGLQVAAPAIRRVVLEDLHPDPAGAPSPA